MRLFDNLCLRRRQLWHQRPSYRRGKFSSFKKFREFIQPYKLLFKLVIQLFVDRLSCIQCRRGLPQLQHITALTRYNRRDKHRCANRRQN